MEEQINDWIELYEQCCSVFREIQKLLSEKRKATPSSTSLAKINSQINSSFIRLDEDIVRLTNLLSKIEKNPSEGEFYRRKNLLMSLKNDVFNLKKDSKKETSYFNPVRTNTKIYENQETINLDNQSLHNRQEQKIKQQDEHLDDILSGVTRLKDMGEEIHAELTVHSQILDDIDNNIDNTSRGLLTNTKKAEQVQEKDSNTWGLCLIFLLLAAIIMLYPIVDSID